MNPKSVRLVVIQELCDDGKLLPLPHAHTYSLLLCSEKVTRPNNSAGTLPTGRIRTNLTGCRTGRPRDRPPHRSFSAAYSSSSVGSRAAILAVADMDKSRRSPPKTVDFTEAEIMDSDIGRHPDLGYRLTREG